MTMLIHVLFYLTTTQFFLHGTFFKLINNQNFLFLSNFSNFFPPNFFSPGDSEILDIEGDDEDDDHDSHDQKHHHHPSPLHPRMNRLFHHLGPIEKGKDTCVSPLCPCNQQHSHLLNSQHSKLFPNLSTTPNNNSIPNTSSLGGQGLQIPNSQHSQGVPPNSHLPPPPHPGSHPLMYCSPFATHSPMGNHHPSSASHLLPGHQRTQVKRVWRVWEKWVNVPKKMWKCQEWEWKKVLNIFFSISSP